MNNIFKDNWKHAIVCRECGNVEFSTLNSYFCKTCGNDERSKVTIRTWYVKNQEPLWKFWHWDSHHTVRYELAKKYKEFQEIIDKKYRKQLDDNEQVCL